MAVPASTWCRGAIAATQAGAGAKLAVPVQGPWPWRWRPAGKYRGEGKSSRRVCSVAVLPLHSLASTQLPDFEFTSFYDDWMPDEKLVKNIYLCFSLFFVWGCCVFGSMKDPFYDSDLYRDAGGDGSGNWVYKIEEEEEMQAREELWREELEREIEERVEALRELEEGQKEKELV